MIQELMDSIDGSFKYLLLIINAMTIVFVYLHKKFNPTPKLHRVLFVIAHPDDEVMFFAPTIKALKNTYFIHILCLTGKNGVREDHFNKSIERLGVEKGHLLQNPSLVDGLKEKWAEQQIKREISAYIKQNNIKAIFTFDANGVSEHPNHSAIYQALSSQLLDQKEVKARITQKKKEQTKIQQGQNDAPSQNAAQPPKPMKIYFLQSVNIVRKYSMGLQMPIALLQEFSWLSLNVFSGWKGMQIYQTEFVWYRKLWCIFSRYNYINTFKRAWISLK